MSPEGLVGIYAYHYAANPLDRTALGFGPAGGWRSPDGRVSLAPVASPALTWDATQRALWLAPDPDAAAPWYYSDDGWTVRIAARAEALGAMPADEVRAVAPGKFVRIDALGPAVLAGPGAALESSPRRDGLRVLVLATDAFGGQGGIARFNRDFLAALGTARSVGAIDVVALGRSAGGVPEIPVPRCRQQLVPGKARYVATALREASRSRLDAVVCAHLHLTPLAALIAAWKRTPLWLLVHGVEAWEAPGPLRRRAVRHATRVSAVSRHTRRRFLEWARLPPERVGVLPNTVAAHFTPGPKPARLVQRHRLDGFKVVLTVARLDAGDRYKGHERVLLALRALRARRADVAYLIVGDGNDRACLEARVRELGLEQAVRFAGHVPEAELPDFYRLADVFAMPSTGEGFGIVFVEAAACGAAVIGGNRDGSVDALADGALGTLVDPLDGDALVAALDAALAATPAGVDVSRFARGNYERQVHANLARLFSGAAQ